jgi:hypothetical protein
MTEELYDWADDTDFKSDDPIPGQRPGPTEIPGPRTGGELVVQQPAYVNPVNGHGPGCECRQCPGGLVKILEARASEPDQAPARKPRPLQDQVIPICLLLAVVTVCGLVLTPVIAPMMTSVVLMLGMGLLALVVTAFVVVKVFGKFDRADNE